MIIKDTPIKFVFKFFIILFAFYINYYYANKGLYPIDTFSFFDTGYYITEGQHPIKDFWIISGILIDYIQALFFKIFGLSWRSYVFHASLFNVIISLFFFYFLNQFNKNLFYNFILSISVAILCYPIIGTPFPYQHSFIISTISILIFYLAVFKEQKIFWFFLPLTMLFSFLCMQLPSGIINLFLIIFIIIYFVLFNKKKYLKTFLTGSVSCLILLFLYFIITKVTFKDFYTQIILFPLDVGLGRITSDDKAFEAAKLANKLTLRGTLGHFKFIFLFLFLNLFLLIFYIKKNFSNYKFDQNILINIFIIFCTLGFIFHQLITANQTFIFSLIPILCGFFILQLDQLVKFKKSNMFKLFLIGVVIFSTFKYHLVYNEKRKFIDLQNVDLSKSIDAAILDNRFNKLKWITPNYNKDPNKELELIKESIDIIDSNKLNKMLITHYQFFSSFIGANLNIPNRWYYPNNTFPTSKNHKYLDDYNKRFLKKISEKNIQIIYVVESRSGEFNFINFENLLKTNCFKKENYNKIIYSIKLNTCD